MSTHLEGLDVVILIFCFIQVVGRAFIISSKYATYSEGQYRAIHDTKLTRSELEHDLLIVKLHRQKGPDNLLNDVATSVLRMQVEPTFLTMLSFNAMSEYTKKKFTEVNFYKYKYSYSGEQGERVDNYKYN